MRNGRIDVELVGHAPRGAETDAGGPGGRSPILEGRREVCDARPVVDREHLELRLAEPDSPKQHLTAMRVLHEIGRELGGDEAGAVGIRFAKADPVAPRPRAAKRTADGWLRFDDRNQRVGGYFHLVITTRVPAPGADVIANSFVSRFAPERPRPRPPAVVKPSFIASVEVGESRDLDLRTSGAVRGAVRR